LTEEVRIGTVYYFVLALVGSAALANGEVPAWLHEERTLASNDAPEILVGTFRFFARAITEHSVVAKQRIEND
jgi:hypothetical protein